MTFGCPGSRPIVRAAGPGAPSLRYRRFARRGLGQALPSLQRRAVVRPWSRLEVTLVSWAPADCGAGCGSAESRSALGSDGRREAPGRAGLRESAQAVATARRRTPRAGLLREVSDAELAAAAALSLRSPRRAFCVRRYLGSGRGQRMGLAA